MSDKSEVLNSVQEYLKEYLGDSEFSTPDHESFVVAIDNATLVGSHHKKPW